MFAAFLILVVIGVVFLLPAVISQFAEFAENLPSSLDELTQTAWFLSLDPAAAAVVTDGLSQVAAFFADPGTCVVMFGGLLAFGVGVIEAISSSVIVVVLTLYFLGSLDAMKSTLYRLTASHSRATVETLTERTTDSVGRVRAGRGHPRGVQRRRRGRALPRARAAVRGADGGGRLRRHPRAA